MNAVSPMIAEAAVLPDWEAAIRAVNLWRGEVIHWFSRGEAAVSETLLSLAGDRERGSHIRLRQLFGQRLEDLHGAVSPGGAFAAEGGPVLAALEAFRDEQAARSALCHGTAKVWLDRNGRWAVCVELLDFAKAKEERARRFITQREAETLLRDLRTRCQRLEGALARVRASIVRRSSTASDMV